MGGAHQEGAEIVKPGLGAGKMVTLLRKATVSEQKPLFRVIHTLKAPLLV